MSFLPSFLFAFTLSLLSTPLAAAEGHASANFITHPVGYLSLLFFGVAYLVVILEEFIHLRKSKPVLLAAGLMWAMLGIAYSLSGDIHTAEQEVRHYLLEYVELLLFLLVAMTYINAMTERQVFAALRDQLIRFQFSYRQLYWITGILAFFISPIADNLTTALLMGTVVMTVGIEQKRFVSIACISVVVAANAGGAFSPFGDVTTLMVWQKGLVSFFDFFVLFWPSVINYLLPAIIMHFAVPKGGPSAADGEQQTAIKHGGWTIIALFLATIVTAVCFHNYLHMPPTVGMMTGLSYLAIYSYYLKISEKTTTKRFDLFHRISEAEWDTLLFFYGVMLCVGALGSIGYLEISSRFLYTDLGPTTANILVGILSAIFDNIPIMFSVLTMKPEMALDQWLLVTLTAGVGGSLLSIGSAAGVALMGQARGYYTFFSHLRWAPVIALGYAASIWLHILINTPA